MKAQTKGNKITIDFGGRKSTFTAGGRKRYMIEDGIVMVNGLIRFADGTEAHCVLEIGEDDGGEHFGTGVFLPDGDLVWQNEDGFLSALGKTKDSIKAQILERSQKASKIISKYGTISCGMSKESKGKLITKDMVGTYQSPRKGYRMFRFTSTPSSV